MKQGDLVLNKEDLKIGFIQHVYQTDPGSEVEFVLIQWERFTWRHSIDDILIYYMN